MGGACNERDLALVLGDCITHEYAEATRLHTSDKWMLFYLDWISCNPTNNSYKGYSKYLK